jgi:dGTPase
LEYKTQVFLNHEGDYFRTRLTHSLEVSQIARTLSRTLKLNETLSEVIALSHDLGHTPFGHVGGDELDQLLKQTPTSNGFDHNFQSFRVLTKLEKRYKEFDGLNLTFATLEGVLKHSYPYKKSFLKALDEKFHLNKHPSLEAIVVDHADEIAYTSHDIDDGIKYGLITFEDLKEDLLSNRVATIVKENEQLHPSDPLYRHRFVAALIKLLVEDFITNSKEEVEQRRETLPLCATIDADKNLSIGFSKEIATQLKKLKKLLLTKLYRHEQIARKMYAGKTCIRKLYEAFHEDSDLLPNRQKSLFTVRKKERVIADYIASMTDRYALKTYHEIYGL